MFIEDGLAKQCLITVNWCFNCSIVTDL